MEEIWKPVIDYEGLYEVSNFGRVKSLKRKVLVHRGKDTYYFPVKEKILNVNLDTGGYPMVKLSKGDSDKTFKTHRLVAIAFIPNPNNYEQVNHKDEIKTNNFVYNLEWCTQQYNITYGTRIERAMKKYKNTGPKSMRKSVVQYDKNMNKINTYESMLDAERKTGIGNSRISACCKMKVKSAGGFIWKLNEVSMQ